MVKLTSLVVESVNDNGVRNVIVSLVADTPEDVNPCGASGKNITGLRDTDNIVLGSTALCADGSFGMINSNGVWNW